MLLFPAYLSSESSLSGKQTWIPGTITENPSKSIQLHLALVAFFSTFFFQEEGGL